MSFLLLSLLMVYGQFTFTSYGKWGAEWHYSEDVHFGDEPFSVVYLTEIFSFSHA